MDFWGRETTFDKHGHDAPLNCTVSPYLVNLSSEYPSCVHHDVISCKVTNRHEMMILYVKSFQVENLKACADPAEVSRHQKFDGCENMSFLMWESGISVNLYISINLAGCQIKISADRHGNSDLARGPGYV
jgi:hypothetical protein